MNLFHIDRLFLEILLKASRSYKIINWDLGENMQQFNKFIE